MNAYLINSILYILLVLVVASDAFSDAKYDKNKSRSHWSEDLSILFWLGLLVYSTFFPTKWWLAPVEYVLIRMYLFDAVYNLTRKYGSIGYIGKTNWLDKFKRKIPSIIYRTGILLAALGSLMILFKC